MTELDICRQTLTKIRESRANRPDRACKAMKKPWLEGIEIVDVNSPYPPGEDGSKHSLTAVVIAASFITQQVDPFRLRADFRGQCSRPCSRDCDMGLSMVLSAPC